MVQIVETILNNTRCFLGDPVWQQAIRRTSLKCDDFGDRSVVSTELWAVGARLPNLFMGVSELMQESLTTDLVFVTSLARRLVKDLDDWKQQWFQLLNKTCHNVICDDKLRHQSMVVLLAYYMLFMITCRLQIAILPYQKSHLEDTVQAASIATFSLRKSSTLREWSARKNSSVYAKIAHATQQTAFRWRKAIDLAIPQTLIKCETFNEWCTMIGRDVNKYSPKPQLRDAKPL